MGVVAMMSEKIEKVEKVDFKREFKFLFSPSAKGAALVEVPTGEKSIRVIPLAIAPGWSLSGIRRKIVLQAEGGFDVLR